MNDNNEESNVFENVVEFCKETIEKVKEANEDNVKPQWTSLSGSGNTSILGKNVKVVKNVIDAISALSGNIPS